MGRPRLPRKVERLYALEPQATAVLLTGSYGKGTAAVASDLALMAISTSPRVGYRTWFEQQSGDAPLLVSVGATTADAWLAKAATSGALVARFSGRQRRRVPLRGR